MKLLKSIFTSKDAGWKPKEGDTVYYIYIGTIATAKYSYKEDCQIPWNMIENFTGVFPFTREGYNKAQQKINAIRALL